MSRDILQESIYWNLFQLCVRAKHGMIELAEKHGLGLMQMYTLCSMSPEAPTPMHSISSLLVCDASNVTGIIDRLVVSGFLTREESSQDRRVKMIAFTPRGVALRQAILDELRDYEPGVFVGLTPAQKRELTELIAIVLQSSRL